MLQPVAPGQHGQFHLTEIIVLRVGGEVVQTVQGRMDEGFAAELILGDGLGLGSGYVLYKSEGCLELDDSFSCWAGAEVSHQTVQSEPIAHTQKRQAIIEPSPSLVKALMRHRKPFQLLRQDFMPRITEQADVKLIQTFRVIVDEELGPFRIGVQTKRSLRTGRSIGPAGLFLGNFLDRLAGFVESGRSCRQTASGQLRSRGGGIGEKATSGAGHGPGRTSGKGRRHWERD